MRDIKILPLWLWSMWRIVTRQNTPSHTPPPPCFYKKHRAHLQWNHVKSQHHLYVIVNHGGNTPFTIPWYRLTQWPTESKSDPAGILQQGRTRLTRLRVNHPCVAVAAIQAGQEGSESSMPNFLTPTQTHNRAAIAGSWPQGTVSGVNGGGDLLGSSELEKYVSVPAAGRQNDGAVEPLKHSSAQQWVKSVCWK